MDLELKGKHVLITGGTGGIGLACAKAFQNEGCVVTLADLAADRLDHACAQLADGPNRPQGYVSNLGNAAEAFDLVNRVEKERGPIYALVSAAGAARQKPFAELEAGDWKAAMEAKFYTYMNVIDPLIKRMAERGAGSIVNIVGMGGKLPSTTHLTGGAANAALMLASAGLAMAYAPRGVRVNAINPSKTATPRMIEGAAAQAKQNNISLEEALAKANASFPMGRPASPEDIASAVVFLSSARASYISGSILCMDGGARPMVV